ncbi:MAG: glycosyltransferase family 25 protein [Holosporaceae bacterium]|jgi:glycosyl transferase family 25|nr:glycosyltransferase family 25 protein [Holosporaceae bacterium]
MKRIRALTFATYYLLIIAVAIFGARMLVIFLNLTSCGGKTLAHLLFLPLLLHPQLFRNSRNSHMKFREYSNGKIIAYVLNMDKATARLKDVMTGISRLGLPFERISAIDGSLLSKKYIESIADMETYKKYFRMLPEVGTIGCALSHEKAWRKFLESDNEFAVIFEDDACFAPHELYETINSLVRKKNLWDVVGFELNHHGHPLKIASLPNGKFLAAYLTDVRHASCYLINRSAARKLLEKFYPIKMPVDHYYTAFWEFNFKFAGVEPRIVKQKSQPSQIKSSSDLVLKSTICAANVIYKIQRAVLQLMYGFFYFLLGNSYGEE